MGLVELVVLAILAVIGYKIVQRLSSREGERPRERPREAWPEPTSTQSQRPDADSSSDEAYDAVQERLRREYPEAPQNVVIDDVVQTIYQSFSTGADLVSLPFPVTQVHLQPIARRLGPAFQVGYDPADYSVRVRPHPSVQDPLPRFQRKGGVLSSIQRTNRAG